MRNGMKERIIGGAILIALAIIVVPMFFGGSGKKDGSGEAPNMTINEEQIDVPDDQQQASNGEGGDGGEGQQQGEGAGSDVSQYSQLLPGSEGPKDINPDAQASVNQTQQGSDSDNDSAAASGDEDSNADQQSHQMEPSQPVHESTAQQHTQPAPAPQRPEHREPAKPQPAKPAPEKPAPSKPAPKPQQANNNAGHSTANNAQPKSAPQKSNDSSIASSDPILAAANRYDSNGSSGNANARSGASNASSSASASGASASGRWSVQAGSFGNAANANNLVKRLKGLGFSAYQISRGANKVVMVGPYNSSGAGESARTQLQQKANINGFVVHSGGNAG